MKKKQSVINISGSKQKKLVSIPEFVEWAVQENGGNYATVCQQLQYASAIAQRMAHNGENFNISTAYRFLADKEFSQLYNLQLLPNEFTVKGVANILQSSLLTCELAVQKSTDDSGIVVTITQNNKETMQDAVSKKQGNESRHSLTTLCFSGQHLSMHYQGDTSLKDCDGFDHYRQHLSNASFTFDHKTGAVTDFNYAHTDNNDVFWNKEQTKSLPDKQEQDDLTK